MSTINIKITGMTCDHCARSAQDALNSLGGIKATVSYNDGLAKVESQGLVENSQLLKAIESKGY
ncbi:MAG: heavy-metal-associated domain-containing protein, partial [Thiohalomonadales bacterium]